MLKFLQFVFGGGAVVGGLFLATYLIFKKAPASVAVLIHGCHVETKNWDAIMFGDVSGKGRVYTGIEEAWQEKAELIIWGSGASMTPEAILESEYTFAQATHTYLPGLAQILGVNPNRLLSFIKKHSLLELKAQNTKEEVLSALDLCAKRKIKKLILVSSPTHIARCLQEACKQQGLKKYTDILVYARASGVCFIDSTAEDVLIVEPPHRIDRSQLPVHILMKEVFSRLQKEKKGKFHRRLTQLLKEESNGGKVD